jgi:hypothetical protein
MHIYNPHPHSHSSIVHFHDPGRRHSQTLDIQLECIMCLLFTGFDYFYTFPVLPAS